MVFQAAFPRKNHNLDTFGAADFPLKKHNNENYLEFEWEKTYFHWGWLEKVFHEKCKKLFIKFIFHNTAQMCPMLIFMKYSSWNGWILVEICGM